MRLTGDALFTDREDAGRKLADLIKMPTGEAVVLGIARGGIPVGYPIAMNLNARLDVVTARKLPIPWSPEMGFGAIAPDGSTVLNEELMPRLGLSREEISSISEQVLAEVRRREEIYRGGRPAAAIKGRNVILTDDGLATGFTMIAAVEMAKKQKADSITVAVPVSPEDTAGRIESMVDSLVCIHIARTYSFAVASFYRDFHDMADGEVLDYLEKAAGRSSSAKR
jgi:putative phosphoribosyl transferase